MGWAEQFLSVIKNPCKSLAWGVIVWRYAGDEPVVVFCARHNNPPQTEGRINAYYRNRSRKVQLCGLHLQYTNRQFGDNHKVKLGKNRSKTNGVKLSKMASGLWVSLRYFPCVGTAQKFNEQAMFVCVSPAL